MKPQHRERDPRHTARSDQVILIDKTEPLGSEEGADEQEGDELGQDAAKDASGELRQSGLIVNARSVAHERAFRTLPPHPPGGTPATVRS
jgi:hypothetical protein